MEMKQPICSTDGPVDLLITDFNMPNMNGAELIKQVRSIKSL